MRLFEIAEHLERLLNLSVNPETGEVEETALDEIDALEMARDEKALGCAAYALGQDAEADAIMKVAEGLFKRAQIHRNHAKRLRDYIEKYVPAGTKLENENVKISWRKSERVEVLDEDMLPLDAWRVSRTVDKKWLREELKKREVAGARLVPRQNLNIG